MKLNNVIALVTGGVSGLGAACVRRIVSNGGKAVIADINEVGGNAILDELGDVVRFYRTDVRREDDVQGAIDLAASEFGGLNVVINCAGIATAERAVGRDGPQPLEHFQRVIDVNLVGSFNVIRLAGAYMSGNEPTDDGERGVIINTASVAAFDGQIGQAAYSASKGGVVAMMLPIAREFARFGIRVMTIAPGIFETPMMAGLPEKARQSLIEQTQFPSRLGQPEEYAQLMQSIVENVMLNGEVIRLDGAIRMAPK
ncbi:MAG: 3-hydroxyacyl-CoA dehydrogenase [Chloroflexi bacterium]|nr:3-hydroxyacyl-CoA dehydrogenase [Chloroflexota bacterium]